MLRKLEYDESVKRASIAGFALLGLVCFAVAANAQIHAAPPSVTSLGFGGQPISGVFPSVTSLGPNGFTFNPAFPNSRPFPLMNPGFPFTGHHHHHHNGDFFPGGAVYAVPYYVYDSGEEAANEAPDEQYNGGPTIFDRRGPGYPIEPKAPPYMEREPAQATNEPSPPATTPVHDEPQTVLIFKDGHQLEVENYAIVGDTLYNLTGGQRHKIALADLDLDATTKQNDDRGIDFQLPSASD